MRKYFTEKAVTGHARVFTAALFLAATALPAGAFDLQGHRGARGLAPVGHCCAATAWFQASDGRLMKQHQAHVTPK